jgi:hypothetical protein
MAARACGDHATPSARNLPSRLKMALRQFARASAPLVGLRCAAPLLSTAALRSYSTVIEGLKYMESHEWVKVEGRACHSSTSHLKPLEDSPHV